MHIISTNRYLFLGVEVGPAVVLLENLAEPAVAHDHPVVEQEQLPVNLTDRGLQYMREKGEKQALRKAVPRQQTSNGNDEYCVCDYIHSRNANGYST